MSVSLLPAHAITPRETPIRYEESTKGSLWLITKGMILTFLTVGIYRFWFKTALRKNIWSRIFIDGSPVEYTGRAHELLLGFLVALAILLPAYIVAFVATMFSPYPTLSFLFAYLLLFLLIQFARYRARRYLASRTVWRGIGLRQDGSALRYTALAAGWWLITLLTLGVAYPCMRAGLERYRMNHTLYGDTRFVSEASGFSVVFNWMIVWASSVLPILGCLWILLASGNYHVPIENFSADSGILNLLTIAAYYREFLPKGGVETIIFVVVSCLISGFSLRPYYRAEETRAFISAITISKTKIESNLRSWPIYNQHLKLYSSVIGSTTIVLVSSALITNSALQVKKEFEPHNVIAIALVSIAVISQTICISYLYFQYLQIRRLAIIAESLTLTNLDTLDAVTAFEGKMGDRLAEGVEDTVDPGGIEIGF